MSEFVVVVVVVPYEYGRVRERESLCQPMKQSCLEWMNRTALLESVKVFFFRQIFLVKSRGKKTINLLSL